MLAMRRPLSFILRVYQFIKLVLSMVSVRRGTFGLVADISINSISTCAVDVIV